MARQKICSEDGYLEENSRHPLKCDRNRQLPPIDKEPFSYTRFSQYVQTKFIIERQQRQSQILQGKDALPVDHYTDAVLKKELFDLYGDMDERDTKFKRIFNNFKDERLEQVRKWVDDEQHILSNASTDGLDSKSKVLLDDFEVGHILDNFSSEEASVFEKVANYELATLEPFILPRVPLDEPKILKKYGKEQKNLISLTEFDPEISIDKMIVPEICDTNVGERLVERMVEIISKHPTGIANTNFLIELKKRVKYYPEPADMHYSSFGEMMNDLGKHMILMYNFPRVDKFYYPMCLQGLVNSPQEMFWNIWHKVKVVLNIHSGIVKVSKALRFCERLFGWGKLHVETWGFESDNLFIEFLITQWSDPDIVLIPESTFKLQGSTEIKYLVLMTAKRREFLNFQSSKMRQKRPPALVQSNVTSKSRSHQTRTFKQTLCTSSSKCQTDSSKGYHHPQAPIGSPIQHQCQSNSYQQQPQHVMSQYSMSKLYGEEKHNSSQTYPELGANSKRSAAGAPITPKPKTWSSLLKK